MRKISADWIFPVTSSPVENGVIVIDDEGRILQISERKNFDEAELETHHGIICPGFINSHCHLELSYMIGRFREHSGLPEFLLQILRTRNDEMAGVQEAMYSADAEMFSQGIAGVGDISNLSTSFGQKKNSKLRYHTFVECNGVNPAQAEFFYCRAKEVFVKAQQAGLSASITPHAPYSLSDELFERIFSSLPNEISPLSFHNQETEEENKLYRGESNGFDSLYKELNVPSTGHRRASTSLKANLKFFPADTKTLLVHNTATSADDIEFAMHSHPDLFWCFCPNANLYIENKLPDYSFWKNYPDKICIGTDSYASNHQLSILEEMKTIQFHSQISLQQLIQWSTLNGAKFFGWEDLGSLEKGKKPGLNLISEVDRGSMRLAKNSSVERLA